MSITTHSLAEISARHLGIQLVGALALVLLTIFLLKILLQRSRCLIRRQPTSLTVIETLMLGPRERLIIVQVDTQQILLGVNPQGITHLVTLPEPIVTTESNQPPSEPHRFSQTLAQFCAGKFVR